MKFYDKKIYELNKNFEELTIIIIALVIGYITGYITAKIYTNQLKGIEQYKFNNYVTINNK